MDVYSIINTIITIILGGGWFIYYNANKRKANGEASQAEADGWKAMQDLYQQTIADFKEYSEDMRTERIVLKKENSEMYVKYKKLDEELSQLRRLVSRQGRRIDAMQPFLCSVAGCVRRQKVILTDEIDDNIFATEEEGKEQSKEIEPNNEVM